MDPQNVKGVMDYSCNSMLDLQQKAHVYPHVLMPFSQEQVKNYKNFSFIIKILFFIIDACTDPLNSAAIDCCAPCDGKCAICSGAADT